MSGLAAAGVAVVGVSLVWMTPEQQRAVGVPPQAPSVQAAPVDQPQAAVEPAAAAPASVVAQRPVAQASAAPRQQAPRPAPDSSIVRPTGESAAPSVAAAATPATVITAAEMRALGIINVADAMAQLVPADPQAIIPALGQAGNNRNEMFINNTIANLRGLDPTLGSRTLTMVDGRPVALASAQGMVPQNVLYLGPPQPALLLTPTAGDRFAQFDTNPVRRTADEPVSTFSIDVDTASYSFARRLLNAGTLPHPDAVRAEEMINYFSYAWPAPASRREPFRPTVTVSDSPWGEGRKLVHIGINGYEVPARSKPDVNLVLLLDVSGSMSAPDRLPLARRSVALLLDSLAPSDTVAIAVYAGSAGEVLAPTPVRERERIEAALQALTPGGSTAGVQGLRLAYDLAQRGFRRGGVNRILLATDGDFNVGVSDPQELRRLVERERAKGIYLSVLGFGQGNYRDDVAQALAQNGNGTAAYIDSLEEARKVLVREATASLVTIASDVKIQVEFNPATITEYRLVGYETRALASEDFNNDRVDAGEVGSGHTVTAIYEVTPAASRAAQIDAPRYATPPRDTGGTRGRDDEYGFVKIRYKLPGQDRSRLLEQAIRVDAGIPAGLQQEVAFSTAVAGFAQLLRGGRHTGDLTYEDVIGQAGNAVGEDIHGDRAGFIALARRARSLDR